METSLESCFKKPISPTINLLNISQKLSHQDCNFNVQIALRQEKYIKVETTFHRDSDPYHHDHSLFSIYKMFEEIEKLVGAIDTIEGQKMKDRWSSYKKRIENN